MIQTAGRDVITDLLDVLDDSERAQKQLETTNDVAQIKEGVQLVFTKLRNTLSGKGLKPMEAVGKEFNADLHEAMARTQLVPENDGFTWTWPDDVVVLERAIWPVVRSAADLLISGELDRVRECAASDCSWLFFDESRNRSRRWCSMSSSGTRRACSG